MPATQPARPIDLHRGKKPVHGLYRFQYFTCAVCGKECMHRHPHARKCCSDVCRRVNEERRLVEKKAMSVAESAYVAGIIDGEGSISLWREKEPLNKRGWRLKATVQAANTNVPLLESIRETTGNGFVARSTGTSHGPRRRPPYQWRLYPVQIRWVLPQLLPYLRLKKRQAEIMLRYFEICDISRRTGPFTDELDALCREIQTLNQRGIVDKPVAVIVS